MKILTVVGARPQFIKAAAISRIIRDDFSEVVEEVIIHTGQHFDANMSDVFFQELDIPEPKYNLDISGGAHGSMTGRMLESIEKVLLIEKPDWMLIYGDTNSTLAGAIAAAKLNIRVAHVEAGLRSFNMKMPEELNRILADRISTLLFCPTEIAVANLLSDGLSKGVYNVGDVMYDVALYYKNQPPQNSSILDTLKLKKGAYALATCHRAENTDDPHRLGEILLGLSKIAEKILVVFPIHPRTRKLIHNYDLTKYLKNLIVVEPLPFLDMVILEQAAKVILTDSGGVQKEAFFYGVPCITMRDETEWAETIRLNANILVGADHFKIMKAFEKTNSEEKNIILNKTPYGDGKAANKIIETIVSYNE